MSRRTRPTRSRPGTKELAPAFIEPMAAQLVSKLPEGDEWAYEPKWDGYRTLLIKHRDIVQLRSRNNKDLTRMYPTIAAAGTRLNAERVIIDGELVALDQDGRPSFQALQHRTAHPHHRIALYAFDVLHMNGRDLRDEPLRRRWAELPQLLDNSGILLSMELPGTPAAIIRAIREAGLEGVVAKRKDSPYQAGERSADWLKVKVDQQQEFVIGGYWPGHGSVDALLVGYYADEQLRFAAKVRAGFVPHTRREVFRRLVPLHVKQCPFSDLPNSKSSRWGGGVTAEEMHEMQWVRPELVAQIRYIEWTAEGRLRHAQFIGLRTDKRAREVRRKEQ